MVRIEQVRALNGIGHSLVREVIVAALGVERSRRLGEGLPADRQELLAGEVDLLWDGRVFDIFERHQEPWAVCIVKVAVNFLFECRQLIAQGRICWNRV